MPYKSDPASASNFKTQQLNGRKFLDSLLLAATAISTAGSILVYTATLPNLTVAQEYEGCFMRNSSGKIVSLNESVCGITPQELSPTAANSGIFQAKIKRREGNIPVIDVTFNGKQSFEMMVDSGASGTVITPAMAKALGITPKGTVKAKTPNGEATFQLGQVSSLQAGGLEVKNIQVAIAPTLDIGLLGHDFFGNKDVTIKENVIEFRSRS
ncbi:retropepsin-like aspartic protease [Kamptonema sp. UHCC 0994]|uniref:retropepsin-like aspartic protease family protein n=1 Tax=Kamptonema sp. UHCC 0994 TaxID=3031329 RepID=UPI0023BA1B47|nr:retropepsin-like aspartic protease [Kamptonema sp. UHCC 0994]MDF0554669.1 retropepsin-like aspartic protease [Kamptonema sp. UHCC 0994]